MWKHRAQRTDAMLALQNVHCRAPALAGAPQE
jgi:hypothetical protein